MLNVEWFCCERCLSVPFTIGWNILKCAFEKWWTLYYLLLCVCVCVFLSIHLHVQNKWAAKLHHTTSVSSLDSLTWPRCDWRGCANAGWPPAGSRGPGSAWLRHWLTAAAPPAASGGSYSHWTNWFPPCNPKEAWHDRRIMPLSCIMYWTTKGRGTSKISLSIKRVGFICRFSAVLLWKICNPEHIATAVFK